MKKDEVLKKLHDISELLTTIRPPLPLNQSTYLEGLPHSARDILVQLHVNGEINQRTLAKHVGCSPQAISKSVVKLEARGLIVKNNGTQKNEKNITLTKIGEEIAVQLQNIIKEYAEVVFKGFSTQDISTFNSFLEQLYDNISNQER